MRFERDRAQSSVVGVALLVGLTVLSLGALTATVGTIVADNAVSADADRVEATFTGFQPSRATGVETHAVAFSAGSLAVEPRTVRILDGREVLAAYPAQALVFTAGGRRVTFLAGAVVRGGPGRAVVARAPPLAAAEGVLLIGLPVLVADTGPAVAGTGVEATLRTATVHRRGRVGTGEYALAVETATPAAWERALRDAGAGETTRRDFDDDGLVSVVATFSDERETYLVVHEVDLEVET